MRFEGAQPPLVEALRRQQQMDPQAAPDAPHPHEQIDQLGAGGEEFCELVHHDQERRQGIVAGAGGQAPVGGHAADPGVAQQLLTPAQLSGQCCLHALDQPVGIEQVGDEAGHVWQ